MAVLGGKLKNKRGASLVIALVFFLFATIIGSVVLASASSNAGRLSHMRTEQQAYLSTSSAASLLLSELEGMRFEDNGTAYHLDGLPPALAGQYPDTQTGLHLITAGNSVSGAVYELVEAVYETPGQGANPALFTTFTIEPDGDSGIVNVRLMISDANETRFALTAELTLAGAADQYPMTLTLPVSFSENVTSGTVQGSYTTTDGISVPADIPYSVTTVNIAYGEGVISKGGA